MSKHSSLLLYEIDCGSKKFYGAGRELLLKGMA